MSRRESNKYARIIVANQQGCFFFLYKELRNLRDHDTKAVTDAILANGRLQRWVGHIGRFIRRQELWNCPPD